MVFNDFNNIKHLVNENERLIGVKDNNDLLKNGWEQKIEELKEKNYKLSILRETEISKVELKKTLYENYTVSHERIQKRLLEAQGQNTSVEVIMNDLIAKKEAEDEHARSFVDVQKKTQEVLNILKECDGLKELRGIENECKILQVQLDDFERSNKSLKDEIMALSLGVYDNFDWKIEVIKMVILSKRLAFVQGAISVINEKVPILEDIETSEERKEKIKALFFKISMDIKNFDRNNQLYDCATPL
uniref:Uncharacterized protein n=1 Tax=Parastrongyloides trichosuri TaxID=131310 RepID=A0A0N5A5E0_PARTI